MSDGDTFWNINGTKVRAEYARTPSEVNPRMRHRCDCGVEREWPVVEGVNRVDIGTQCDKCGAKYRPPCGVIEFAVRNAHGVPS